jgi:hypothetical protein
LARILRDWARSSDAAADFGLRKLEEAARADCTGVFLDDVDFMCRLYAERLRSWHTFTVFPARVRRALER